MREETRKIYFFDELPEESRQKALDRWRESYAGEANLWQSEMLDSLKAIFEASGIKLTDYCLGLGCYNYVTFDMDSETKELSGARALAWLENNLFSDLRITRHEYLKKRKSYFSYGSSYRIDKIKPCPFTGYCFDDDLIEALLKSIFAGCSIGEAYSNLASVYQEQLASENEYQNSDEYLIEHLSINGYEFLENGQQY